MSAGGLSVRALSAEGMPSVAMQWIEMMAPTSKDGTTGAQNANSAVAINATTNDFVRLIKDPLNLISVLGPARSGKSTLMNLLAGSSTELFATSSGALTFTKGIYIPTKIVTLPEFSSLEGEPVIDASDSTIKLSFVDTEGQGAVGKTYDLNLFTPALLCSKAVIYNRTGGLLTDDILKDLGMMTQAGQRLSGSSKQSNNDAANGATNGSANGAGIQNGPKSVPQFGHLFVLFNRFQLNAESKVETLRAGLLDPEAGDSAAAKERNEIRKLLKTSFASVTVYILPDSLKSEVRDEMADNAGRFITIKDFTPKYLTYFKTFRTALATALKEPHCLVAKSPLTGGAIADFMPKFADALNAQEPLNVPSIFETSRNDAINRALTKLKADFTVNIDAFAAQPPKPTVDLARAIDAQISLMLRDMEISLSYMPPDVLSKLRSDATDTIAPIKSNAMSVNFLKLQSLAATKLKTVQVNLDASVQAAFPPEKLAVSQAALNSAWTAFQTSISGDYESVCTSLDPKCMPDNWRFELTASCDAQKAVLQAAYASYWTHFIQNATTTALDSLRVSLDDLVSKTAAGDSTSWDAGQLTATDAAKSSFKNVLTMSYLGPDADTVRKNFEAEVDSLAKTRQALWSKRDQEVLAELSKRLKKQEATYSARLTASLAPEMQPPAFDGLVNPQAERDVLVKFIESSRISSRSGQDTLEEFDGYVSTEKQAFLKRWNDAVASYDSWLEKQIALRKGIWTDAFEGTLTAISLAPQTSSVARIREACDAANAVLMAASGQFKQRVQPLRAESTSALMIENLEKDLQSTSERGKRNKLIQFDELAVLYNRALLSKKVKPVVDRTLSDKQSYTSVDALDAELRRVFDEFSNEAVKPLALPESSDHAKQWEDFKKRAYAGLAENVRRNGMATTLNGKEMMPRALQIKILKDIRADCANLANYLGFGWISEGTFGPDPSEDANSMGRASNDTDVDTSKSRVFSFNSTGGFNGFWQDRWTNMQFGNWTLEQSDYVLGRPVMTEVKPAVAFSQTYPAEKFDRPATVGGGVTVTTTITNSNNVEGSIGGKWAQAAKVTGGVAETTTTLEATFGAKFSKTWGDSESKSFQVSGSSTVTLPAGRANTVTSIGFDQQCTVPYTAKFKFAPSLSYTHGFVRAGGQYLKKEWFNKNKSEDRVYKDFDMGRTDQLRDKMNANTDPWDWIRFKNDGNGWLPDSLANDDRYTFYVKGKWEGITGKLIISTVTPGSTTYDLVPSDS